MLSSDLLSPAIVVFREIFEIAIILGVLMAATHGLPSRNRWVMIGLAMGVFCSILIAAFVRFISAAAEGMGHELLNAIILFAAVGMISWTVVWMRKHGKEIVAHIKNVGKKVIDGDLPLRTIAVVIMLATLREGSEIVLFTYGALAAGKAAGMVLVGSLMGAAFGTLVGFALYLGLLRIPVRHLFSVTSWLLIFIAAGMAAQGAGLLVQADKLPELAPMVWDTSAIIPETSLMGQLLHALVGYTAQPSGIQLVFYGFTILLISAWMYGVMWFAKADCKAAALAPVAGLIALAVFAAGPAHAQKVYKPYVEKGELEVEWYGEYKFDDDEDQKGGYKHKLATGYAPTDFWYTEIVGEFERENEGSAQHFEKVEWENIFQLTERGEHFVDVGLLVELSAPVDHTGPFKAETKLLLAKDVGKWLHLMNVIVEREFGPGHEDELEGGLAWSSRYLYSEKFQPGFEIYSEFGEISHPGNFDDQEHMAGPVFYGDLGYGFGYEIGYLFGLSEAAPDGAAKWLIEWEKHF